MIYAKYDIYLIPAAKFIIALAAFLMINSQIGFMEKLASPVVAILLALLCSFLPVNMIVLFGALMVCVHAFALSMEVFAVAAGIFHLGFDNRCQEKTDPHIDGKCKKLCRHIDGQSFFIHKIVPLQAVLHSHYLFNHIGNRQKLPCHRRCHNAPIHLLTQENHPVSACRTEMWNI